MNINTWGVFNHVIIGNDLLKKKYDRSAKENSVMKM